VEHSKKGVEELKIAEKYQVRQLQEVPREGPDGVREALSVLAIAAALLSSTTSCVTRACPM
jgi:hypothetical protein